MLPYIVAISFLSAAYIEDVDAFFDKMAKTLHIEYHLYSRNKSAHPEVLTLDNEDALAASSIGLRNKTFVYIHGYSETPKSEGPQKVLSAHTEFMDCNVIMVDWSSMSGGSYHLQSAPSVPGVGKHVAKMMKWLEDHKKINISDLHIIGYSLGAHVAGYVGKALAPKQARRITGLDPAYPTFMYKAKSRRIHKTDAQYVDIIHTNSDLLGIPTPLGHADFYPNYGAWQPGCEWDLMCSHRLAWKYYAESLSNPYRFLAFKCSFKGTTVYNCQKYGTTVMGFHANTHVHGTFYVAP